MEGSNDNRWFEDLKLDYPSSDVLECNLENSFAVPSESLFTLNNSPDQFDTPKLTPKKRGRYEDGKESGE
jgi:hypothetical protein